MGDTSSTRVTLQPIITAAPVIMGVFLESVVMDVEHASTVMDGSCVALFLHNSTGDPEYASPSSHQDAHLTCLKMLLWQNTI